MLREPHASAGSAERKFLYHFKLVPVRRETKGSGRAFTQSPAWNDTFAICQSSLLPLVVTPYHSAVGEKVS